MNGSKDRAAPAKRGLSPQQRGKAAGHFIWGYLDQRTRQSPQFFSSQTQHYRRDLWKRAASFPWALALLPKVPRVSYVFVGSKFREIIAGLERNEVLVVGGNAERMLCRSLAIPFWPHSFYPLLLILNRAFGTSMPLRILRWMGARLLVNVRARALVLVNDSLPIERALILAARAADVPVIVIQHGLFQHAADQQTVDGRYADLVLAYDETQAEIIRAAGARQVRVMGFYQNIKRYPYQGLTSRICFLGQPWARYDADLHRRYEELLTQFARLCRDGGSELHYKPHPGELDAKQIATRLGIPLEDISLEDAIARYDYFVSITSTALYQVTLAGKVAVQIYDPLFSCDRFDQANYANTIDSSRLITLDEIVRMRPLHALAVLNNESVPIRFRRELEGFLATSQTPHRDSPSHA